MSAKPKKSKLQKFGESFVEGVEKTYVKPVKWWLKGQKEKIESIGKIIGGAGSKYHEPPTRKMKHGGKVRNPFTEQYD
jgi:hypothetical protein